MAKTAKKTEQAEEVKAAETLAMEDQAITPVAEPVSDVVVTEDTTETAGEQTAVRTKRTAKEGVKEFLYNMKGMLGWLAIAAVSIALIVYMIIHDFF